MDKIYFKKIDILYFFPVLIPFSYYAVLDVRVILIAPFLLLMSIFFGRKLSQKNIKQRDLLICLIVILYCLFLSNYNYNYLFSLIIFLSFLNWPYFLNNKKIDLLLLDKIIGIYNLGVLFIASGVFTQVFIYKVFGLRLGMIEFFGSNRIAYGFIWKDFSFLSLYLVSSLPLFFYIKKGKNTIVLTGLVFLASTFTSARTGPYSLIIFNFILMACEIRSAFYTNKKIKSSLLKLLYINSYCLLCLFVSRIFTSREVSMDGSGRGEVLANYLKFVSQEPSSLIFGNGFSSQVYAQGFGAIPHNVFFDIVLMGGGILLLLIFIWIYFFKKSLSRFNPFLLYSLFISLVGFNFIPSFFSAYYVAYLLSLFVIYDRAIANINTNTSNAIQ